MTQVVLTRREERAVAPTDFLRVFACYGITLVACVAWGASRFAQYEWLPTRIVIADHLWGAVREGPFGLICLLPTALGVRFPRSWLATAAGCAAIAFWVLIGHCLCGLHVT